MCIAIYLHGLECSPTFSDPYKTPLCKKAVGREEFMNKTVVVDGDADRISLDILSKDFIWP